MSGPTSGGWGPPPDPYEPPPPTTGPGPSWPPSSQRHRPAHRRPPVTSLRPVQRSGALQPSRPHASPVFAALVGGPRPAVPQPPYGQPPPPRRPTAGTTAGVCATPGYGRRRVTAPPPGSGPYGAGGRRAPAAATGPSWPWSASSWSLSSWPGWCFCSPANPARAHRRRPGRVTARRRPRTRPPRPARRAPAPPRQRHHVGDSSTSTRRRRSAEQQPEPVHRERRVHQSHPSHRDPELRHVLSSRGQVRPRRARQLCHPGRLEGAGPLLRQVLRPARRRPDRLERQRRHRAGTRCS